MNAATRAQARAVQKANEKKLELDSITRETTFQKVAVAKKKRKEAYENTTSQLQDKVIDKADILKKQLTEMLKLTYQPLDGMVSKLPNGRKETYVTVLLEKLKPNAIRHVLLND